MTTPRTTPGSGTAAGPVHGAPAPWPWARALAWLAFLGPFFFLTYGFANWSAAQRTGVPSVVFGWEHAIPFWAWTILPYWSIDLLYGLSLFLCATKRELDTHARRLVSAQLVAVTCFLAWPLRFTFERPPTDGAWGFMFDALAGFDQPFNQLPSLHIALAVILWSLYARRLAGWARGAMDVLFFLICASVLTTYQHHFIDVPTGFLLGWLCVWAWPFADEGTGHSPFAHARFARDARRYRLAGAYALGATVAAGVALATAGAALWLLWVTVALLLVAANYAVLGVAGFGKSPTGRLTLAARWLYAPYLAAAWINSRLWTADDPSPVAIADGVWLGRIPTAQELAASPFAAVVDLTAEFDLRAGTRAVASIPVLDLTTPTPDDLARAAAAIERLRADGPVLVCCALGYSRSACAVAAWLLATGRAGDVSAALAVIRQKRARIALGARHVAVLGALPAGARP